MKTEVKICGLTRRSDAELVAALGADYLGFVLTPRSRRYVAPEKLPELARNLGVPTVGVFVDADLDFIQKCVELGELDIVQLHGRETADFARQINFARVWKATYDAHFPVERLVCDAPQGGSGQFGDHRRAAELARERQIMLAGGITPDNVENLINLVRPAGIDLAGGVESAPGIKDKEKLQQLFRQLERER